MTTIRKDAFWAKLAGWLRSVSLGRHVHSYWPTKATLFDGDRRLVHRRAARTLRSWRKVPHWAKEGEQVREVYNGGDILDIGAYHGIYQFLLAPKAQPGDRFFAFEPDPRAFPVLLSNLSAAAEIYSHVSFSGMPFPAGDGNICEISFPQGEGNHPQFLPIEDSSSDKARRSISIDSVVEKFDIRVRFVKVDVEGAELSVLRGMKETLMKHRPTVMMEIHPPMLPSGVKVSDVVDFMLSLGYVEKPLYANHSIWIAG